MMMLQLFARSLTKPTATPRRRKPGFPFSNNWRFETLEDRRMLAGDGIAASIDDGMTAAFIACEEVASDSNRTTKTLDATASTKSATQRGGRTAVFTINDAVISEPAEDMVADLKFTVFRTGNTDITSYVDYHTLDGTAEHDLGDYDEILETLAPETQKLTFLPGETSKDVFVVVRGNLESPEGTDGIETFSLVLSRAENATISSKDGIGTGSIRDTPPGSTAMYVNSISVLENARGTYFAIEVLDANDAPVSGAGVTVKLSDEEGNIVQQWYGETNNSGIMTTSTLKSGGRFGLEPDKSYNVEVTELFSDDHVWEQELELDTDGDGLPDINFTA